MFITCLIIRKVNLYLNTIPPPNVLEVKKKEGGEDKGFAWVGQQTRTNCLKSMWLVLPIEFSMA